MNTEQTKYSRPPEQRSRPALRQLLNTTEGHILFVGIVVALIGLVVLGMAALRSPQTAHMIGVMAFFNITFGRAVSMSIGYAGGYGHAVVVSVNMWVETVLVLLFYPVFVFSMRKLVVFPKLKRYLERTRAAAERHRDKVRRYGIIGLLAFVWLPFWMTGPVVGCAIGYLLGMSPWLTIVVVLIGTYIAMGGWAFLMFDLHHRAAELSSWAPLLLIGLIILIVLAGYWLKRRKRDRKTV